MAGYHEIAEKLAALITKRVLRAGERLPSIRRATRSHRVNPGTVIRAYRDLEARGLVESRLRSGYYVRPVSLRRLPDVMARSPRPEPTPVVVGDLIVELVNAMQIPHMIPLGLAMVNPELLPEEDLNRAASKVTRRLRPGRVIAGLTPGDPELRRLIALRYMASGCAIDSDDVVIMSSGLEAVVLCLRALTEPGDTVAIETPNAWPQLGVLEGLGLRVQEIFTDPRDGVDLDALERAFKLGSVKACLVMPTFQNPLGSRMPDERKQALAKLVARYGIPLIENDSVAELYFEGTRPRPVKAFDEAGFVLHCGSMEMFISSAYQIGWVAAGRYHAQVARTRILLSISASAACQAVLAEYLGHGPVEMHLRRLRQSLAARCQSMASAISDYFPDGCRMTNPGGGLVLWVELPEGTDSLKLYRLAFAKGISIAPGPMFSARRAYGNCMRLNFGFASVQQIRDGVRAIAQLIGPASA